MTSSDFATPTKAKRSFTVAKNKILEYRKKIRGLQRTNLRLKARVTNLGTLLTCLKKKNLITETAAESIEVSKKPLQIESILSHHCYWRC